MARALALFAVITLSAACSDDPESPTSPETPVTSIAVVCEALAGGHNCTAVALLANNAFQTVTTVAVWTSSNTTVATVSSTGRVTHRATGQTAIRATYGGVTGSTTLDIVVGLATPSVVINEFATRSGPNDACGEFVEIRNDTSQPVGIGGWQVLVSGPEGGTTTYALISTASELGPGCHFLIATNTTGLQRDLVPITTCNLPDSGGLALMRGDGTIVDQVGMGSGSAYREGTPLPSFNVNPIGQSYARVGSDTNNNASDFAFGSATPLNINSPCSIR